MKVELTGSCLCGDVEYRVTEVDDQIGNCHCTMCRKFHGAAYSTFAASPKTHFEWLKGAEKVADYKAENGTVRQFCRNCGSSLTFSSAKAPETIEFALATLDTETDLAPDANIYTDFKAAWCKIDSSERQYPEGRDS